LPIGYWENKEHHLQFAENLGKKLGFKQLDDWYHITKKIILKNGGGGLLKKYDNSPSRFLQSVYHEHDWIIWKFKQVPKKYWHEIENGRQFLEWAGKQLGIQELSDWYEIPAERVSILGGSRLLNRFGGKQMLLQMCYPHYSWNSLGFQDWQSWKSQKHLFSLVREIFPTEKIHYNYRHPEIKYEKQHRNIELDIFIPTIALAFEYQVFNLFIEYFNENFLGSATLYKSISISKFYSHTKNRSIQKNGLCQQSYHIDYNTILVGLFIIEVCNRFKKLN
jgi:hypothetical protein